MFPDTTNYKETVMATGETVELTIRKSGGKFLATMRLDWDGAHTINYTVAVSPNQTFAEIETLILRAVKNRLEDMLPAGDA
jgi:hypothetical protein